MTTASIVDELATLWIEHDDRAGWRHPDHARELADAACLTGVVFPELIDRILTWRRNHTRTLSFSQAPRLVAQTRLDQHWGYLNEAARERHGGGLLSRRPDADQMLQSGTANYTSQVRPKRPGDRSLTWILRQGHGTAVSLWRAHRTPPAPTGFEPVDADNRSRSEWERRTAFEAILSRPRLSRHLRAELLQELGITVDAGRAAIQGDLLADEPGTPKGAGIRIAPANYRAALSWSRHPQCEPELAYLIQRALAATGNPRIAADLVLHPDAHPIVQSEARTALVRRMVYREQGALVRFLGLTSPWCPATAIREALGSLYPEERRAAELHPAVEEAWRQIAAVPLPTDPTLGRGRVQQTELRIRG